MSTLLDTLAICIVASVIAASSSAPSGAGWSITAYLVVTACLLWLHRGRG